MKNASQWALVTLLTLCGCAHSIHEVHVSDFHPMAAIPSGEMVTGKAEQFVILGFTNNTDYVNQALVQLQSQCPQGTLTGISTQISTSLGFFSWHNKALMQGLCVTGSRP